MNKDEYWQTVDARTNPVYKKVHEELKKWKKEHNITEQCNVHHRDDNDEVRVYNETYYERWGCEEDGTFIEGKYVQFLTVSEHSRHHNAGRTLSDETKQKISESEKGKKLSDETKQKMSVARKGKALSEHHRQAISNGQKGKTVSDETRKKISANRKGKMLGENHFMYGKHHTEETLKKISANRKGKLLGEENPNKRPEVRQKISATKKIISELWKLYKQLHPDYTMTFNEFQKSLK